MRNRLAILCAASLFAQQPGVPYRTAVSGYRYEFPRDHFSHPEFQTEWWYYTGNVQTTEGHRFGFELTFFRQGVSCDASKTGIWGIHDLFLAHLALSDLDGGQFYHAERLNRAGPGIAGASEANGRIWNGNWQVQWDGVGQTLQAVDERFRLYFVMHPEKLVVIHGENGISQKAEGAGQASHYVSFTRLQTKGEIELQGKKVSASGLAWMDHEFFTHQLESNQSGWDWFSIQLEDNTELMLFYIRRKDGSIDPYSAETFVDAQGRSTHLRAGEFTLQPSGGTWTSAVTHATYPVQWKITVSKLDLELEAKTPLESQEVAQKYGWGPNYWEGAIRLAGRRERVPLRGVGYLEMTGYDKPVVILP